MLRVFLHFTLACVLVCPAGYGGEKIDATIRKSKFYRKLHTAGLICTYVLLGAGAVEGIRSVWNGRTAVDVMGQTPRGAENEEAELKKASDLIKAASNQVSRALWLLSSSLVPLGFTYYTVTRARRALADLDVVVTVKNIPKDFSLLFEGKPVGSVFGQAEISTPAEIPFVVEIRKEGQIYRFLTMLAEESTEVDFRAVIDTLDSLPISGEARDEQNHTDVM